ncbi:MAG TPA: hypothetical protein VGS96_09865 [Thermoanaerobaculia bacterium]|jgi:hypothetical protein|nr:hypothetical protein [Thermoanaerobaculia bacterium]
MDRSIESDVYDWNRMYEDQVEKVAMLQGKLNEANIDKLMGMVEEQVEKVAALHRKLDEANADKRRLVDIVLRLDAKYDGAMTSKEKALLKAIGEEFEEGDGKP